MNTVPNQRIIKFDNYNNYKSMPLSINELEPSKLKLYCYLFSFKNNYDKTNHMVFYSTDFMTKCNISRGTYSKAFSGLVKKGYLVDYGNNTYLFCPDKYMLSDDEILSIIKEYIINKYTPDNQSNKSYYDYSLDYHEDESCLDIFPEVEEESYDGFYHIPDECISKNEDVPF